MPGLSSDTHPAIQHFRAELRKHEMCVDQLWRSPAAEHVAAVIAQSLRVMRACSDIIESLGVDPTDCVAAVSTLDDLGSDLYLAVFKLVLRA